MDKQIRSHHGQLGITHGSIKLQDHQWTIGYNPRNVSKFNGAFDPRQLVMSFEAVVTSAGWDECENSFFITEGSLYKTYKVSKNCRLESQVCLTVSNKIKIHQKIMSRDLLRSKPKLQMLVMKQLFQQQLKVLALDSVLCTSQENLNETISELFEVIEKSCRSYNDY